MIEYLQPIRSYDIFDDGDIEVYSLAAREEETDDGTNLKGSLFWVECIDGQFPMDFSYAQPEYTIATTATHTFRLVLASDVQYDSGNAKLPMSSFLCMIAYHK